MGVECKFDNKQKQMKILQKMFGVLKCSVGKWISIANEEIINMYKQLST